MEEQYLSEAGVSGAGVSVHAGFPNAAIGSRRCALDLSRLLIKHPAATFMMRLNSNAWARYGMFAGDIVIVDRAVTPNRRDTVVWCEEGNFVIGKVKSVPGDTPVWGTVSAVIHQFKK